jgi:hypothetical protein
MADEIMQELWAAKDAIAEEAGYDLDKLCTLLKEWQAESLEEKKKTTDTPDCPGYP